MHGNYRNMVEVDQIPLRTIGGYNVVVETPRGSRIKFAYDPATGMFEAKKLLAMGFAFPFPFGFLPSTQADDGDPVDVVVLTELDLPTGTLVRCRVLGGLAMEDVKNGVRARNDRLLAVPLLQHQDRPSSDLSDLPSDQLTDLEDFFVAYPASDGKRANMLGRLSKEEAESLIARDEMTWNRRKQTADR